MWDLERGVRADALGAGRTVVRLEFTDQPAAKKYWWFVNENGHSDLCLKNPGMDVDLYLAATLRDMVYIRRGDLSLTAAIDTERLEVVGSGKLRSALRS